MIPRLRARLRSLWLGLRRHSAVEAEMGEEFRAHIELRAADLAGNGLSHGEALLQARREFGSTERYKEEGRAARGLRRIDELRFSWLDIKLGFRMLVKYPGLTVIGGLAMALAITVGVLVFEIGNQLIHPKLPLEGGDRIVAIRLWNAASRSVEEQAAHDFVSWRAQVQSIVELGASRTVFRNLVTSDGQAGSSAVAEISASAFRLAQIRPLLGRPLQDADELPGASPVLVIGERIWRTRFASDAAVIGRTVRLGNQPSTVVGVMPESFAFPLDHSLWVPLPIRALSHAPGSKGPAIRVFGRLGPGVTLGDAQAELTVLGQRASADFPDTHRHLRPQVMPYARSFFDGSWRIVLGFAYSGYAFAVMFLVLVCANVATLVFARTATRESEIVMRTALGASRKRVVTQLLAETLVLGALAALLGLAAADSAIRLGIEIIDREITVPFWVTGGLSPVTVLWAVALTILGALIAGALPALKVTRGLAERIRQGAVGGTSLRFGRVWTGLIVTQVALTVVFMMLTLDVAQDGARARYLSMGFPAEEYLGVTLEMVWAGSNAGVDLPPTDAERAGFAATHRALQRRLAAQPEVAGVTVASSLPGMFHPWRFVELDGAMKPPQGVTQPGDLRSSFGHLVLNAGVDATFFDVLGARIIAGRGFQPGDLESDRVVVVNQSFVRQVLGMGNAIGRRVRYVDQFKQSNDQSPPKWYEIIGVVQDIAMTGNPDLLGRGLGGVYHPFSPAANGVHLAVHVRGDPSAFAPRVHDLATEIDPSVRITQIASMAEIKRANARAFETWLRIALVVCGIILLLSVSGVYSTLSFTVARRTREIGIRSALGARPHSIVLPIFSRALMQVSSGILVGVVLLVTLMGGIRSTRGAMLVAAPTVLIILVCLLACVMPAWRALRVEPTEALRADG